MLSRVEREKSFITSGPGGLDIFYRSFLLLLKQIKNKDN